MVVSVEVPQLELLGGRATLWTGISRLGRTFSVFDPPPPDLVLFRSVPFTVSVNASEVAEPA